MSLSRECGAETSDDAGKSVLTEPMERALENEGCDNAADNHDEQNHAVCVHFFHALTVASRPMNCTQKEG